MNRAAFAATALAAVLVPWFTLDEYTATGWDASLLGKVALIAALIGLALASSGALPQLRVALAVVAVLAVGWGVIVPPAFGFDYDGLDVPTERAWGLYVALGAALTALLAELARLRARPARPDPSPGSPRSGTAAEGSASGPAGPAPA